METVEVLKAARELLSDPAKWGRYNYARNDRGEKCDPCDITARCFCALGAVVRIAENYNSPAGYALHRAIPQPYENVADFNDDPATTHADVLALFDRAIANKSEGA